MCVRCPGFRLNLTLLLGVNWRCQFGLSLGTFELIFDFCASHICIANHRHHRHTYDICLSVIIAFQIGPFVHIMNIKSGLVLNLKAGEAMICMCDPKKIMVIKVERWRERDSLKYERLKEEKKERCGLIYGRGRESSVLVQIC